MSFKNQSVSEYASKNNQSRLVLFLLLKYQTYLVVSNCLQQLDT